MKNISKKKPLPKTVKEAQIELKKVRQQQNKLLARNRELTDFIISRNGHFSHLPDNTKRDKAIYLEWKRTGKTYLELASKYSLSEGRVWAICDRKKRQRPQL